MISILSIIVLRMMKKELEKEKPIVKKVEMTAMILNLKRKRRKRLNFHLNQNFRETKKRSLSEDKISLIPEEREEAPRMSILLPT